MIKVTTFAESEAKKNSTFAQVLLMFLCATRKDNWELHLLSVRSMLLWFFVTDRIHSARYGIVYCLEMLCLEETRPGKVLLC